MDQKSKIFFVVFFLLIAGSIGAAYYRYFVVRDYMITAQAECDPYTEACFVAVCDPSAAECTGDPEEDTSYYKEISRNARHIPLCDPTDEGCTALICPEGEEDCTVTLCDVDTVSDGAVCNDPVAYAALHLESDAGSASEGDIDAGSEDAMPDTDEGVAVDGAE